MPISHRTVEGLRSDLDGVADLDYPPLNGRHLAVGATCGIGHRLLRNARIFHAARSAGYAVGIDWFPWAELFADDGDLFAGRGDSVPSFRFGNEPGEIRESTASAGAPPITLFGDLVVAAPRPIEVIDLSKHERWRREVFSPAATDHLVDFHRRMLGALRPRWRRRVNRFLERSIGDRRMVAVHLRTGNGETGDFVDKGRNVTSELIMTRFASELRRHDPGETVVFVASDSAETADLLRSLTSQEVCNFAEALPVSGFFTGNYTAESSSLVTELDEPGRVEQFFEAYADMVLLAMADDLYAGAYSSFLAGPFAVNRARAHRGTTSWVYDSATERWRST